MRTEQQESCHQETEQKEFRYIFTTRNKRLNTLICANTKNGESEVVMNDMISRSRPKVSSTEVPKETTYLYLLAMEQALGIALKTNASFFWNFSTPCTEGETMEGWYRENTTTQLGVAEKICLIVPKDNIEQELKKIQTLLTITKTTFEQSLDGHVDVLKIENYLSLKQAQNLTPNQLLYFDESPEGKNLAKTYDSKTVRFVKYKKTNFESDEWPIIIVKAGDREVTISSHELCLMAT
jgi:hypothetical protein